MESIADKLKEIIDLEENKNSTDKNFNDIEQLLVQLDKMRSSEKPSYSFPLVDTIGKTTYSILNRFF